MSDFAQNSCAFSNLLRCLRHILCSLFQKAWVFDQKTPILGISWVAWEPFHRENLTKCQAF